MNFINYRYFNVLLICLLLTSFTALSYSGTQKTKDEIALLTESNDTSTYHLEIVFITLLSLLAVITISYIYYLTIKIKQLNHHHSKFERLFEQSTDAMILVHEGTYIAVNHAAVKLFGYPDKDSLLTTKAGIIAPIYQLDGQRSLDKMRNYLTLAKNQGTARFEWQSKRLNNDIIWLEIVITGIEYQNDVALHMVCRNINEKKQLEMHNQHKSSQLEKANQDLTQTINNLELTRDRLVESEKMASLGGLVAGIAHEINTPIGISLTGISKFAEMSSEIHAQFENNQLSKRVLKSYLDNSKVMCNLTGLNLKRAATLISSFKQIAVDQTSEESVAKGSERREDKAKTDEKAEFTGVNEHFEPVFNAVLSSAVIVPFG